MFGIFELLGAVLTVLEIACFWTGRKVRQSEEQKRLLVSGNRTRSLFGPVDRWLERKAGRPNKIEAFAARKATSLIRSFVNTQAFDHSVTCLINQRSSFNHWIRRNRSHGMRRSKLPRLFNA